MATGPDGTLDKVTESVYVDMFSRPLSIISLGADGMVLYSVEPYEEGGQVSLYLSAVGQPPVLLASGWGGWTSRYDSPKSNFVAPLDGRWHLVIAGTLYALTDAAPLALTAAADSCAAVHRYGGGRRSPGPRSPSARDHPRANTSSAGAYEPDPVAVDGHHGEWQRDTHCAPADRDVGHRVLHNLTPAGQRPVASGSKNEDRQ